MLSIIIFTLLAAIFDVLLTIGAGKLTKEKGLEDTEE